MAGTSPSICCMRLQTERPTFCRQSTLIDILACADVLLQALRDYLEGKVATVPQLDENVPLVPFEPPAKRQKLGGTTSGFFNCIIPLQLGLGIQ